MLFVCAAPISLFCGTYDMATEKPRIYEDGAVIHESESESDKLKFHDHVSSVAHKAYGLCQSFLKSTVCRTPDFMMFLLTTHIRPLMEYASCIWNTGYMTDLRKLERVQRMWTRQIKGLEGLSYGERLSELSLFSVQGRLLRADLIQYWKIFHDLSCIKGNVPPSRFYN